MLPTIKIVVISIDATRTAYMKQQFIDLKINLPIEFFEGYTPATSTAYVENFNATDMEDLGTLCCFRTYAAVFDKYKNDEYEYLIVAEDDISITQNNFVKQLYQVINTWKKYKDIEYVHLGFNLYCLYDDIKKYHHEENLYYDMYMYPKLWGLQLTIFKRETVFKLANILHNETAIITKQKILDQKITYSPKAVYIQIDAIIPLLCKFGIFYPLLAIENNIFKSNISSDTNSQEKYLTFHPYVNFFDFYRFNTLSYPKSDKIIGISFTVVDQNSITKFQDVFSFMELISSFGYEVYLITDKKMLGYKSVVYEPNLCEKIKFDIVFEMSMRLPIDFIINLQKIKCKIVLYKFNNESVSDAEKVLFSDNTDRQYYEQFKQIKVFDQIWCSEHLECSEYYEMLFRSPVINVPVIWSPKLTN